MATITRYIAANVIFFKSRLKFKLNAKVTRQKGKKLCYCAKGLVTRNTQSKIMKALPIVYCAHSYKLPFYYAPGFFNYLSLNASGMNATLDFIYLETVKL